MSDLVKTDLGSFPKDWPFKPVGQVFDTQLGKMLSQKAQGGDDPKPYLRNKNVQWGHIDVTDVLTMDFNEREKAKFKLRRGDLLVCEGGVVGRSALWNGAITECYYQKALHRLRPTNRSITNEFMFYWLRFAFEIQNFYGVSGASSTIAHLPAAQLRALEVPLPPLPEQQKIAHILSTVQRAIEAQERIIQTTTELKKTLMHKLFTEGLRNEPQKQTEFGPVPESWEVVEIGDVFKFTSGKTKPKDTAPEPSTERMIPVYGGNGVLGYSAESLLDEDVLILGRVGEYCGCAHLTAPVSWVTDNALYAKEEKRSVNRSYARTHFEYLNLNQYSNKMGQPLITQGIINRVKFGLPPREEQDELANAFETLDTRLNQIRAKRSQLQDLFRTLLHELMTAKTRIHEIGFEEEEVV